MTNHLNYELKLTKTASAAGYFIPTPSEPLNFDEALQLLSHRPLDDFLHRYALNLIMDYHENDIRGLICQGKKKNNPELLTLACEQILLSKGLAKAKQFFSIEDIENLQKNTPLINIRSALRPNRRLHNGWIKIFKKNMVLHNPLPSIEQTGLPPICQGECAVKQPKGYEIKDIHKIYCKNEQSPTMISLKDTAEKAMKCLKNSGIELEKEMRHQSSLSPFALLRKWHLKTSVHNKKNIFSITGTQTSYGKGLSLEQARASLSMEIVERCSAFGNFSSKGAKGYKKQYPLTYGSLNSLADQGIQAVNPGEIALEVEYKNEPLHWIEGSPCTENEQDEGTKTIMIPAQAVFLFCNLDEISLFSGLGSTGFASGSTMEQAKVSALLEVIERHQENTVPFSHDTCFRLISREPLVMRLLESYSSLGIDVFFQDITPASGIPCCKCFVKDKNGTIHKGTSAHLDAKKAIISALTETPYPISWRPPVCPGRPS